MTVTDLRPAPASFLLPVAIAPREERRDDLIALADLITIGTMPPPSDRLLSLQVRACAWHGWTAAQAMEHWGWLVDETERRQAVEAGDPYTRGVSAQMCREDEAASLADLLDGTDTYGGNRCS